MLCLFTACGQTEKEEEPVPVSISLAGMKTDFEYGERFTTAGLVVTVTLSDGSVKTANVGEYECDSSQYNAAAVGSYTIIVKLKGVEVSAPYTVTVSKKSGGGGTVEEPQEQPLDVWILAGQSNAAGYSNLNGVVTNGSGTYRDALAAEDARNTNGYDVLYCGAVDILASQGLPSVTVRSVSMGLGKSAEYIGPESGMANVLSEDAAIIKFAVGGTFLCDFEGITDPTQRYGNWASPSMTQKAREEGKTIHENNGLLYDRFLETVRRSKRALEDLGYTLHIRGIAWMQGEADDATAAFAAEYEEDLTLFLGDLRSDIAEIMGDITGEGYAIKIGKISPSGSYGGYITQVRAAQDAVAAAMTNVVTVETEDLRIVSPGGTILGTDLYHFNPLDMYELGKRFILTE